MLTATRLNFHLKITGGDIKVEVGQGDTTDALDSNGDIIMAGRTPYANR